MNAADYPYREVMQWRLWERLPRTNRIVGHIDAVGRWNTTRCGRPTQGRMVSLHVTVARAIGVDDCKACLRGDR